MCEYIGTYERIYLYIWTNIFVHMDKYIRTYGRIYSHIYEFIHTYSCMYKYIRTYVWIYSQVPVWNPFEPSVCFLLGIQSKQEVCITKRIWIIKPKLSIFRFHIYMWIYLYICTNIYSYICVKVLKQAGDMKKTGLFQNFYTYVRIYSYLCEYICTYERIYSYIWANRLTHM